MGNLTGCIWRGPCDFWTEPCPALELSLCMGWLPWKLCSRRYFTTEYRTVVVPDTTVIAECCTGYELLGHYCVQAKESFKMFVSRPGICPMKTDQSHGPNCTTDYDCPGCQKCCVSSNGSVCALPVPPALDRNTIKFWYNGTITIKMKYADLERLDKGFTNHSRLLHAMITGELWPLEAAVYHSSTIAASPFTVMSRIFIGINESSTIQDIAQELSNIVERVTEVINVQIDDLDECFHPELNSCPPQQQCVNTEGSYNCTKVNTMQMPPPMPRKVYTALVTFHDRMELTQSWQERVKTEAQILNATLKIENYNLTEALLDRNSAEYQDFFEKFVSEVKKSLSGRIPPEKVTVQIVSLRPGSIDTNFIIIINDTDSPNSLIAAALLDISNSTYFEVNPQNIKVTDFNECLVPSNNDCDLNAYCKKLDRSYTCECHPKYIDKDPSRPGRSCEAMVIGSQTTTVNTQSTSEKHTMTTTDISTPTSSTPGHVTNISTPSTQTTAEPHEPFPPTYSVTSASYASDSPKTGTPVLSTPTTGEPANDETRSTVQNAINTALHTTTTTRVSTVSSVTEKQLENVTIQPSTGQITPQTPTSDGGTTKMTSTTTKHTVPSACSFSFVTANPGVDSSSITTKHPPSQNLSQASRVMCEMGKIGISIEKAFLRIMSISSNSLFLGNPNCTVSCSNDTHILLQAGWKECNTSLEHNDTHSIANSTLYLDFSSSIPNMKPWAISFIRCIFKNDIFWSSGYSPSGGFFTVVEKLEGGGDFKPEFQLFFGDQPITPNFTLSTADDITVQIRIKTMDVQYKVVINECWATPTENPNDQVKFPFIKDRCALPNTFTTILTNGISNNATFQTKIFSYVNNPIVYLHCRLHVCEEDETKTCKPECNGYRAVRMGDNVYTGETRMGPLFRSMKASVSDMPAKAFLNPGYIILITIGVLAFVAIIVAILVCWHQRRTGNYNFKKKPGNVSYQAFSN
ncbi:uromodulin-like 1 [Hyperolius riggenbachi]|uniref:uromodulin-like 1 n=1 Tax=Hyperolius riggenbachi TaxID=752182 RepID=UPI0035A30FE7